MAEQRRQWGEYDEARADFLALVRLASDFEGDVDRDPPVPPRCPRPVP
jgi:hypothetical protein